MRKLLSIFLIALIVSFNSCDSDPQEQEAQEKQDSINVAKKEADSLATVEHSYDCNQLPTSYTSYDEAIKIIKSKHFKIEESVNTSNSTWIRGASYYSCDGNSGFLIINTDRHDYLHSGVPITIWHGFKNTNSFGNYYDHNIKHKYRFNLN
jgi:hypothetical protein